MQNPQLDLNLPADVNAQLGQNPLENPENPTQDPTGDTTDQPEEPKQLNEDEKDFQLKIDDYIRQK